MEPKVSMTCYAIGFSLALSAFSIAGYQRAAIVLGVSLVVFVLCLAGLYLLLLRRAQRTIGRPVPTHRQKLERWVAGQLILVSLTVVVIILAKSASFSPADGIGYVYDISTGVLTVGLMVVYLSATIDWFVVLPRVSGIITPAPCEISGEQRWNNVTSIWAFHRGAADIAVAGCVVMLFVLVGKKANDPYVAAALAGVGAFMGVGLREFISQAVATFWWSRNPTHHLGDILMVTRETSTSFGRVDAYLLDIATQGAKFRQTGRSIPSFDRKHDAELESVPLKKLTERNYSLNNVPPCASACERINWYCRNNPRAHSQSVE